MPFGTLFLLQAESSGCSSTFLLLHACSCLPLDGLSCHHGCLGKCGRWSMVDNWLHTEQPVLPAIFASPVWWVGSWLEVVLTMCSGLQLLDIIFPSSWCHCPPSLLPGEGSLNTQKLHVEHLLIMELAVKSQDIQTSIFFVLYGSEPLGARVSRAFPNSIADCWTGGRKRGRESSHTNLLTSGTGVQENRKQLLWNWLKNLAMLHMFLSMGRINHANKGWAFKALIPFCWIIFF